MAHQPFDPLILDQMYDHPEMFCHMNKDEYIKLLIEDIRYYRDLLGKVERIASSK